MIAPDQQQKLAEAFERIEGTILPCIAMMLESLLDASASLPSLDAKVLAAELETLSAELEDLIRGVEHFSPAQLTSGDQPTHKVA